MEMLQADGTVPPTDVPAQTSNQTLVETKSSPKRLRKKPKHPYLYRRFGILKKWCWRLTATWSWLHVLMRVFFGKDKLLGIENFAISRIGEALSYFGFSPTNKAIFPFLIKAVWLSLICEFSIIQIIFFISFYLLFFPIWVIFLVVSREKMANKIKRKLAEAGARSFKLKTVELFNRGDRTINDMAIAIRRGYCEIAPTHRYCSCRLIFGRTHERGPMVYRTD
jgi:hypothetical protein